MLPAAIASSPRLTVFLCVLLLQHCQCVFQRGSSPVRLRQRAWRCQEGRCIRVVGEGLSEAADSTAAEYYRHLEGCKSVCGPYGSLWPKPSTPPKISQKLNAFKLEDVAVKVQRVFL